MLGLVAHMRRIERAGRAQMRRERLDLGRRGMKRRGIVEPRRHPDRAGIERLLQSLGHPRDLVGAGRPVELGHRAGAQRRMTDEARGIDRRRRLVERREVIGKARIGVIGRLADQVQRRRRRAMALIGQRQRRETDPAIAGDDRGDALARLCRHLGRGEQGAVVMGMHIDEPGRDYFPGNVDLASPRRLRHLTHGGDAVARYRHIGTLARPAGAVDHGAAAQDITRPPGRHDAGASGFSMSASISMPRP